MKNDAEYISDKKAKLEEWKDHLGYFRCSTDNIQGKAKIRFVNQLKITNDKIDKFESVLGNISQQEEIITRKEIKEDLEEFSEELDSQVDDAFRLKCSPNVSEP